MYYDDEARRFNFLSGFLLGAVLGTGIALVAGPQKGRGRKRRTVGSAAEAALSGFRNRSEESISKIIKAGKRL